MFFDKSLIINVWANVTFFTFFVRMKITKIHFFLIFLFLSQTFGANSTKYSTIPLPHSSMYASKGVHGNMALGRIRKSGCRSMLQWRGRAAYSYSPKWDGGANFTFLGGDLNSSSNVAITRYFLNARYHLHAGLISFYTGPMVGVETTNLNRITSQVRDWSSSPEEDINTSFCEENYGRDGVGLGWEMGMGWTIFKDWTFLLAESFEFTSKGRFYINLDTGLAFDIRRHIKALQSRSNSFYIYLETGINLNSFGYKDSSIDTIWMLGFSLGL
jgi:hypothetical protein